MSAASVATSKSLPTAAAVIQQQQPKSASSSSAAATTIQLKDAPAGMKMIPAGATAARILPKPGSGSAAGPSVSSPVYMVATSAAAAAAAAAGGAGGVGQNFMRVARAVTAPSTFSATATSQTATVCAIISCHALILQTMKSISHFDSSSFPARGSSP